MSEKSIHHEHDLEAGAAGLDRNRPAMDEAAILAAVAEAERLAAASEQRGPQHLEVAVRLSDLVRLYLSQNAFAKAVPPLLRLLELRSAQGEEGPEVATILASLASVRQELGEHDAAAQLWLRALRLRDWSHAPNRLAIAMNLEHLADARAAEGELAEALALHQRALGIREQALPAADPAILATLAKIADLQVRASREATSRPAGSGWTNPSPPPERGGLDDTRRGPGGWQGAWLAADEAEPVWPAGPGPPRDAYPERTSMHDETPGPEAVSAFGATSSSHALRPKSELPLLFGWESTDREGDEDDGEPRPSVDSVTRWLRSRALAARAALDTLAATEERVLGERPRRIAVAGGVIAVALLALLSAHRNGVEPSAASPTPAPSVVSTAAGDLEAASAPVGVAAGHRRTSREGEAPEEGTSDSTTPQPTGTDEAQADTARSLAFPAAGDDSLWAAARLPGVDSALLAGTMRAVESSTVSRADSTMRRVLYGGVLALDPARPESAASAGNAGRPAERAAGGMTAARPTAVKPAALAAGSPTPEYPPMLQSAGVEGRVLIELVVNADGRAAAGTVRVLHSDDSRLTELVLRALPQMRFTPAEAGGRKIPQQLQLPFTFTRESTGR